MNEASTSPQVTPCGLALADRLERLLQLPLACAEDVEPWTAASDEVGDWIEAHQAEIPLSVPHHLLHYFNDADIRAKDPAYRIHQEEDVRLFITQLRGEPVPERKPAWWRFW